MWVFFIKTSIGEPKGATFSILTISPFTNPKPKSLLFKTPVSVIFTIFASVPTF